MLYDAFHRRQQQLLQVPMAERPVALKNGRATVPITQYLDGLNFNPETERVMGVAFELVCATLRLTDVDKKIKPVIARKILELATFGERDPNELCDGTLSFLAKNRVGRINGAPAAFDALLPMLRRKKGYGFSPRRT